MDKLKVFSKKLKMEINPFDTLATEGVAADNVVMAWNNGYGTWVDKGWNNGYGTWVDKGWNNGYGTWTDQGWNNGYGAWVDKGWNNGYGTWSDGGGSSGGGCFISSACVRSQGLNDDCRQLVVLRALRNSMIEQDEDFRELVLEYYRKAPQIVSAIDTLENSSEVYEWLYHNLVERCVALYEEGAIDEAIAVYKEIFKQLEEAYLL